MTWDARDIITPTTPGVDPFTVPPGDRADTPPPPSVPQFAVPLDEDGALLDRAWAALHPTTRELARQMGYVPPEEWDRWRQVMTRGIDGIV